MQEPFSPTNLSLRTTQPVPESRHRPAVLRTWDLRDVAVAYLDRQSPATSVLVPAHISGTASSVEGTALCMNATFFRVANALGGLQGLSFTHSNQGVRERQAELKSSGTISAACGLYKWLL